MMFFDRLVNLVSGLGTAKDKTAAFTYALSVMPDDQLSAMHRGDWIARKLVDIIPNDMTREWRAWQASKDQIEKIEAVEKDPRINVQAKVNLAMRKARLMGGAGIYMGLRRGDPSEVLDLSSVRAGDLQFLHVFSRRELTAGQKERDISSPWFGGPAYYDLSTDAGIIRIHPSRIVRFIGAEILDESQDTTGGWGDSVLQVALDAVQNAMSAQGHIAALLPEAKTDVISVPNLSEHLKNPAATKAITERFALANQLKSMFNMLLLEGNGKSGDQALGETWSQKQISFANLPELAQMYLQVAAGSADIPITRFLSQSPAGLSATGESDTRNYYDNVGARQRTELQPQMHVLDEVVIRSALGTRDPSIYYSWRSLWSLTEKEKAEVTKTYADAARAIVGSGGTSPALIPAETMGKGLEGRLIEDGAFPGLEGAIEELGGAGSDDPTAEELAAAAAVAAAPVLEQPIADAAPRTLYVSRKVVNAEEIIAWAKGQGFATTLPAGDLHVTIAFSRTPLDWMKVGESWQGKIELAEGGPRLMERFGEARVLLFRSSELEWRHESICAAGASWDHPEYQPHITISYGADSPDLSEVEPYRGRIVLGPEIFAEVKEDWAAGLQEE